MKWTREGNKILLPELSLNVEVMEEDIIRIYDNEKKHRPSYGILPEVFKAAEEEYGKENRIEIIERKGKKGEVCLMVQTSHLVLQIEESGQTALYRRETQKLLCRDYQGKRIVGENLSREEMEQMILEGHAVHGGTGHLATEVVKELPRDMVFYGLGDKTGTLDKRGYDYEMWNSDNPNPQLEIPAFRAMYKSIPFLIAHGENGSYGIFYDNPNRTYWDLGYENEKYFYFGAEEGGLDYYMFGGDTIAKVISQYTRLTGRYPLPQLWTLGYQQSRWSYTSQEEVLKLAAEFRRQQIPCDVIHLDIDYMDDFKVFTWNPHTFPEPEKMIQKLEEEGIKIVTIIDPGTKVEKGYDVYETGIKEGYFARAADGSIYENVVWPGDSVYPDFTNKKVRQWWGDLQKRMVDAGVRGIWNDMNEPASFKGPLPDDVAFSDEYMDSCGELTHKQVHNVYGQLMSQATYEGLKKHDGRRPFVITRACYSGIQKYATAWTGDNHSIWAHLQMSIPQLCNLGMSGMPFVGTDIGGFGSNTTPELLARWVEAGCFAPLFRNHSAKYTRRQEPWLFGEEIRDIYRKYVNLRYHLLPYYYDLFKEHEETGLPVLRPLVLEYEEDKEVYHCNDEFMIGSKILVAPVVSQGITKRCIYLPEGKWVNYFTGEWQEGGRYVIVDASLDTCPIFIKDGTVLPVYPYGKLQSTKEAPKEVLYLRVWDSRCKDWTVRYDFDQVTEEENGYRHYQDNGEDFAYQKGEYNTYQIILEDTAVVKVQITHKGYLAYQAVKLL